MNKCNILELCIMEETELISFSIILKADIFCVNFR